MSTSFSGSTSTSFVGSTTGAGWASSFLTGCVIGSTTSSFETYFENFHSFYVINDQDENIENRTINELDVYLTEKQNDIVNDFIKHRRPAIITGGAGTGKTVILLHILNDIKLYNREKYAWTIY